MIIIGLLYWVNKNIMENFHRLDIIQFLVSSIFLIDFTIATDYHP